MDTVKASLSTAKASAVSAAESAAAAAEEAVSSAGLNAACKTAEKEIEKHSGRSIKLRCKDVPLEHAEWVAKTGINSLCVAGSWAFLEDTSWNARKLLLWAERDIRKIVMTVRQTPEEFTEWKICEVEYEPGSRVFTIAWYPRALQWRSDVMWDDPETPTAAKKWWVIADEIVFGLQLFRIPGKCLFKADWVDNFDDVDPDSYFERSTTWFRRWLQCRHWTLLWFARATPGWNHHWSMTPPKTSDGGDMKQRSVLEVPGMPELPELPRLKMLKFPDMQLPKDFEEGMPEQPEDEDEDPKAIEQLKKEQMARLPKRPTRPRNPYAAHGMIEIPGLHVVAKGNKLVLSGATVHHFWELEGGKIEIQRRDRERFELKCASNEQADSWAETLIAAGAVNDEFGGMCIAA